MGWYGIVLNRWQNRGWCRSNASMDRIDSSKGYIEGPSAYNNAKGRMNDEEYRASEQWAQLRAELIAEQVVKNLAEVKN